MRYEALEYSDDILPIIFRDDTLLCNYHEMYLHWHDAVEILYIVHGKLRIVSGSERSVAEAGQVVCIHSGHMHLYESLSEQCRYYCIIFPQKALDSRALYQSALPRVTDDGEAVDWMKRLVETLTEQAAFYKEKGKGLLAQLYVRLAQISGEEQYGEETRPTPVVKKAVEYLNDHYYHPSVSVEKVAAAVGVSRYHLCHIFKEVTGKTLSGYWQGLRCDRAKKLLARGASVAQAAEQSGFSSQSYFCRVYQKHYGVLPSKDRR